MKTVVCVLRSGGIYTPEWVQKLQRAVAQHLPQQHRFVCISDVDVEGVEVIPLKHQWPGWWCKIELFRRNLFTGPVLYLDLDVLVVGDLTKLFASSGFFMCQDFLKMDCHNSSVMAWCGDYWDIYETFISQPTVAIDRYDRKRPGGRVGDQAFIEDQYWVGQISTFDRAKVLSYKADLRGLEEPPSTASVVVFHGKPKMIDVPGWPRSMWSAL